MSTRLAAFALLATLAPAAAQQAPALDAVMPPPPIDQGLSAGTALNVLDGTGSGAAILSPALPLSVPAANAADADVSLAAPPSATRLRTPLDAADIEQRIDKGLTAAGEASTIPADYAFGAFQRGYFLTAFSLALDRAKEGDAVAQTLLGELLSRGLGVKQDLAAAADWYGLAAKQGQAEALYSIGRAYAEGRGAAQDFGKAADALEQAAKQGHAVAAREFAYLVLQGQGRPKNAMLGAAYLRRAAGLGDMDAQFALAGLYAEGVGVVPDDTQAARWYAEAAHNGHVGAEVEYGIMLFNGRGVLKNEAVAARWFREAALSDNPLAQVRLARLHAEGRGVEKDAFEAARWYLIAKSRGFPDDWLDDWLGRLDAPTLDRAKAAASEWSHLRGRSFDTAALGTQDGPQQATPAPSPVDNSAK
jgi:TPR repeat protein